MEKAVLEYEKRIWLGKKARLFQDSSSVIRSRNLDLARGKEIRIQEITLGPGAEMHLSPQGYSLEIVVPLLGEVKVENGQHLEIGELWTQFIPREGSIPVYNPYENESIHFIRISVPSTQILIGNYSEFELESLENNLSEIWNSRRAENPLRLYLGKIGGRQDVTFDSKSASLAMCISGAFEYQNCLLESGDCLEISEKATIDLECLSPEGLILVLEFGEAQR